MSLITATNLYFRTDIVPNGAWLIDNVVTSDPPLTFTDIDGAMDFANAMATGTRDQVIEVMRTGFVNPPEAGVMYHDLLEVSNVLQFEGAEVYSVLEVGVLDEFLVEAGEALAAAILVLETTTRKRGLKANSTAIPQNEAPSANGKPVANSIAHRNLRSVSRAVPDRSITWTNYSNVTFGLSFISSDRDGVTFVQKPISEPDGKHYLRPHHTQTLSWYQNVFSVETEGSITITDPSGMEFAIQIHAPTQVFGIGTSPYFRVGQSDLPDGSGGFNWRGEYRSEGYTFSRLPSDLGEMVVRADAAHKTLALTISISPPK